MLDTLNTIEILSVQISALLDLIQCVDKDCVCIKSIQTAAEMCSTMHDEIMIEVNKLYSLARVSNVKVNEEKNNESR